jgi:radical SAM superfamily enzyme YgiQ (UPF0313 family)
VPASITFYNKQHLLKFYEKYKQKKLSIGFVDTYFKFEDIDEETAPLLKDMNFHSMKLGLESSNENIRQVVGKNYSNEHVKNVTRLLNENDIMFKYSFIYNFPFYDHTHLHNDLKFIIENELKYIAFNRFELYNETEIELNPDKYNLIECINDHGYIYYERINDTIKPSIYNFLLCEIKKRAKLNENVEYKRQYFNNYIQFKGC